MADLQVTHLLTLANTRHPADAQEGHDGPAHDHLAVPEEARSFLAREGLAVPDAPPSTDQLGRLRQVRDLAYEITDVPEDRWNERLAAIAGRYLFRLGPNGEVVPAATGWDGFTASLVPQLYALRDERERLRRCANPTCRWLFVDRSKNHSRVWCEMSTCGSRAKMTRYRSRRKESAT